MCNFNKKDMRTTEKFFLWVAAVLFFGALVELVICGLLKIKEGPFITAGMVGALIGFIIYFLVCISWYKKEEIVYPGISNLNTHPPYLS